MADEQTKNVVVALSGGVDSAMAAVLLKEAGWEVYGIHLVLSGADCERGVQVKQVSDRIGIPLEVIDLRERFERVIVKPFCEAYLKGLTPNPCVRCNQEIKFEALDRYRSQHGICFMATGHYARVEVEDGKAGLLRGRDMGKDQSYFLQRLSERCLLKTVLPLGEMTKQEIQARARAINLRSHLRPESQEICFVAGNDYRDLVEQGIDVGAEKAGAIVDEVGMHLGKHQGIHRYTIGQRHGLRIASSSPYYVKALRPHANEVVVARREALFSTRVYARDVHWIGGRGKGKRLRFLGQVRYRHQAAPGWLEVVSPYEVKFVFDDPQWAVTPGQALALYDGDRVAGSGWIVGEPQGVRRRAGSG